MLNTLITFLIFFSGTCRIFFPVIVIYYIEKISDSLSEQQKTNKQILEELVWIRKDYENQNNGN